MNASPGLSGPLQAQPNQSKQLGLRQSSRHHGRMPPARCFRCTTDQLKQIFLLPGASHRQEIFHKQHVEQERVRSQWHYVQQCVDLLKPQSSTSAIDNCRNMQHMDQPQLAYACSSSNTAPRSTSDILWSISSLQPQPPRQRQSTELGSSHFAHGSLSSAGSSGGGGSDRSNRISTSSPVSDASCDGLPPLSDLLGSHSTSFPMADQLQKQDSTGLGQGPPPAAALEGNDPNGSSSSSSSSDLSAHSTLVSDGQQEDSAGVKAALAMLRWYKSVLSPMMQSTCRFLPTCSQYSMDSYRSYGVAKGTVLTAWRLLRCNPWGPSGYDPTQWPPPGLAWLFQFQYSAEVAVVVGTATFVRLAHALLFE